MSNDSTGRDPDLFLERVALGELNVEELTSSSDDVNALKRSDEDILERYPPSMMAPAIQRKLNRCAKSQCEPIRWWQHLAIGVPVAAAAARRGISLMRDAGEISSVVC